MAIDIILCINGPPLSGSYEHQESDNGAGPSCVARDVNRQRSARLSLRARPVPYCSSPFRFPWHINAKLLTFAEQYLAPSSTVNMSDVVTPAHQQRTIHQALQRVLKSEASAPECDQRLCTIDLQRVQPRKGDSFDLVHLNFHDLPSKWDSELGPAQIAEIGTAIGQIRGL